MLVQSTTKDLYLLPALPRDKWPNGCVKGLKARGGETVNICWQEGGLEEVGLWSKEENSVKALHYRGTKITAKLSSGKVYTFNKHLKCAKTYSLSEAAFCWTVRSISISVSSIHLFILFVVLIKFADELKLGFLCITCSILSQHWSLQHTGCKLFAFSNMYYISSIELFSYTLFIVLFMIHKNKYRLSFNTSEFIFFIYIVVGILWFELEIINA